MNKLPAAKITSIILELEFPRRSYSLGHGSRSHILLVTLYRLIISINFNMDVHSVELPRGVCALFHVSIEHYNSRITLGISMGTR